MIIKLRELASADISSIAKHANNPKVSRYLTTRFPYPYSMEDARWWVTTGSKENGIVRAISLQEECIGIIGIRFGTDEHLYSAEIGYWLSEQHWGRGFMTAALGEMTDMVFADTDLVRLYAPVFSANHASMRVLEKNGYTQEAVLQKAIYKDGEFYNEHIFARLGADASSNGSG